MNKDEKDTSRDGHMHQFWFLRDGWKHYTMQCTYPGCRMMRGK